MDSVELLNFETKNNDSLTTISSLSSLKNIVDDNNNNCNSLLIDYAATISPTTTNKQSTSTNNSNHLTDTSEISPIDFDNPWPIDSKYDYHGKFDSVFGEDILVVSDDGPPKLLFYTNNNNDNGQSSTLTNQLILSEMMDPVQSSSKSLSNNNIAVNNASNSISAAAKNFDISVSQSLLCENCLLDSSWIQPSLNDIHSNNDTNLDKIIEIESKNNFDSVIYRLNNQNNDINNNESTKNINKSNDIIDCIAIQGNISPGHTIDEDSYDDIDDDDDDADDSILTDEEQLHMLSIGNNTNNGQQPQLSSSSLNQQQLSTNNTITTTTTSTAATTSSTNTVGRYQTTAFINRSSTSLDQQHLVSIPNRAIITPTPTNTTTTISSRFIRFCQNLLLKMAISAFIFILAISIYQSFLILTFKCDQNNSTTRTTTELLPKAFPKPVSPLSSYASSSSSSSPSSSSSSSCDPAYSKSSSSMLMNSEQTTTVSSSKLSKNQFLDTEGKPFPWHNVRLPTFIRPKHYNLFMNPDMKTLINVGNVSIDFMIIDDDQHKTSRFVIVHTKKLIIVNISMIDLTEQKTLNVIKQQECLKLEQLYIEIDEEFHSNKTYRLNIEFRRQIEDQLEGFYVSSYFNEKKKQRQQMLTTHFEPTLARTAFPCFDEPAMKASFKLQMIHDPEYGAYFNTEKINERDLMINGSMKRITEFEPTVPMSTYLVAFIVCDFSMVGIDSNSNIKIGALVPVGQEMNARFALNATKQILAYFENFFKIPYPLKKLDVVAVPDFGAGAMENWGLITFRMTTLLYNEKESSSEVKEQVAIVVSHEVAHQWFGNLVTMDWWNDLWLNEGFASFVENLGVDHIHPEWRMLDQFVISTSQQALALDSLLSSHPINTTVNNPADIEGIFDLISYKKGSCLIRMIVGFLGLENLQHGLEKYLNRYKFQTAKTSQLWESFSEASVSLPVNVSAIMGTWIFQQGYPMITVRWSEDSQNILVEQQPFISSLGPKEFQSALKTANHLEQLDQLWIVPLTLITPNHLNESKVYWLQSQSISIPMSLSENPWLKLNHKQSGFYRVNYEEKIWRQLIQMLNEVKPDQHLLSPSDRAGLIDDAFSLMRIGYLDVNTAMDLTRYLEFGEHDYVPWETMLSQMGIIDAIMPQNLMFHRYILKLIEPMVMKLGWNERPTDGLFEKKLRAIVLRAAVYYGHQQSIDKARHYFQLWMNQDAPVPANIRDIVYNAGVEHGSDLEWNYCLKKYSNTTVASEKRLLLGVLGSTRNHYLLSVYLKSSLNRTQIRTQDTYYVIQNVARNPIGREMAWKFLRSNWQQIFEMLGLGSFALDTIISETTWHFSTEFEYKEVENYFSQVPVGSGKQAMKQSLEKIRSNIYWKENIEPKVIEWLEKFNPK